MSILGQILLFHDSCHRIELSPCGSYIVGYEFYSMSDDRDKKVLQLPNSIKNLTQLERLEICSIGTLIIPTKLPSLKILCLYNINDIQNIHYLENVNYFKFKSYHECSYYYSKVMTRRFKICVKLLKKLLKELPKVTSVGINLQVYDDFPDIVELIARRKIYKISI